MKKIFALMISMLFVAAAGAQNSYKVTTAKEKKGILFEEFTGVRCHACSEGHIAAEQQLRGLQGQAYVVAVHAKPFSNIGDTDNYTTDDGNLIEDTFLPTSFPSAMINRRQFVKDAFFYDRGDWHRLAKSIKNDTALVNLYVESSYDDASHKLNVHVEGYATEDVGAMKLCLLITQDYINGRQIGNDNKYIYDYTHMHMLRDYITPVEGDAIDAMKKGEFFSRDYVYDVPAMVKQTELKPGDMNVIAYVTPGMKSEIYNVKGAKPSYTNMSMKADAELSAPDIAVAGRYGFKFFEATLRNKCADRITEATFDVTINGTTTEQVVKCSVAPFETAVVKVPCSYEFDAGGKAAYNLSLAAINGTSITPSGFNGEFARPATTSGSVKFKIYTDRSADENTFVLKDEYGSVIKEYGPYPKNKSKEYIEEIVLDADKTYCFEVTDAYGNGMSYGSSKAGLTIIDGSGNVIDRMSPINGFGTRLFFTINNSLGIDGCTAEKNESGTSYTISGMAVKGEGRCQGIIIKNGKKVISRR